ncbi:MAG TPA: hypothetical protein VL306_02695, partial [Methylomirabilota bacterium]|nr:hypothetical protein [Methylomirabilota bacterium]
LAQMLDAVEEARGTGTYVAAKTTGEISRVTADEEIYLRFMEGMCHPGSQIRQAVQPEIERRSKARTAIASLLRKTTGSEPTVADVNAILAKADQPAPVMDHKPRAEQGSREVPVRGGLRLEARHA